MVCVVVGECSFFIFYDYYFGRVTYRYVWTCVDELVSQWSLMRSEEIPKSNSKIKSMVWFGLTDHSANSNCCETRTK